MEPQISTSSLRTRVIDQPQAAALLADARRLRLLGPFFKGAGLVSAARELNLEPTRLRYWVRRFLHCGLLEQADLHRRPGRAIRVYRTTADRFFIPLTASTAPTIAEAKRQFEHQVTSRLTDDQLRVLQGIEDSWGVTVQADGTTETGVSFRYLSADGLSPNRTEPGFPAYLDVWATPALDYAQAKALQAELLHLFTRYGACSGSQRYTLRLALCPASAGDPAR